VQTEKNRENFRFARLYGNLLPSFHTCLDVYGPRPIATDFGRLWFKVTTADVYPASLRGLINHRREPRWIFARFHLNGAQWHWPKPCRHQVREATEVTRFAIVRHSTAIVGEVLSRRILLSGCAIRA